MLLLKRKNYTVCSIFEIPQTVDKLGFSYKERHAKVWFFHLSVHFYHPQHPCSVKWCLRNAPLHPESNKMLLEWNISRTPFVHLFPSSFFIVGSDCSSEKRSSDFKQKRGKAKPVCACTQVCVCVCVCVCSHAHTHALGWDGMGDIQCVLHRSYLLCWVCLQMLIKYSAGWKEPL